MAEGGILAKKKVLAGSRSAAVRLTPLMAVIVLALFLLPSLAGMMGNGTGSSISRVFVIGADGEVIPHYFGPYPNYATSQLPIVSTDPSTGNLTVTSGIRKFIDSLPGLGVANANNQGHYIPVAVADQTTYANCDYYEIAVVEYEQNLSTDLNPSTLRGYVQLETAQNYDTSKHITLSYLDTGRPIYKGDGQPAIAYDVPSYLGPFIIAQRDRPVRVNFTNLLPTGVYGDLFLPVDTTTMGAGMGPIPMTSPDGSVQLNPDGTIMYASYTENRANIHLHGGVTPWISDGTPHQWITPAGENTVYPEGVSVYNVPDMPDPGPGSMTFYYTNQQSARLMFYHDHSYGITRLNVYAGEAAGYILEDDIEKQLVADGILPGIEMPLVIQDKTFVPDDTVPFTNMYGTFDSQLAFQDPTWDTNRWGQVGDLWYPHVYMTMSNPGDPTGMNPYGRWFYAPWFYPPVQDLTFMPVANPYYTGPGNPMEPLLIPGVPSLSSAGEGFMDTAVVNGVAYPYVDVDPQAYRFRILNAADDRFWNLQLYVADETVTTWDGRTNTEVKMLPAKVPCLNPESWPANWPTDGRAGGVPDPATRGPNMIQIGNEGGFLPFPTIIENQPVNYNTNPGNFDVGLVNQFALCIGPAERADVIVDFSQFAGKTIILYNDAPAPFPAIDPRQDYYTGHPDLTDSGGSPSTLAGYGPNTRTLMQIRVADIPAAQPFNMTALYDAFNTTADHTGVFAADQDPIIVTDDVYDSAYGESFTHTFVQIQDKDITFTPLNSATPVTMGFEFKAMHDEMGAAYDLDYGRMTVLLGLEQPNPTPLTSNVILFNYPDPPTEVIAPSLAMTPIGTLEDGTQIWKLSHNGVDSHVMHWHLFNIQIINRVAWDNNVRYPQPNELGWKETLRVDPLQDTIFALRPILPTFPFDIPDSIRPLDVTRPIGALVKQRSFDPLGTAIVVNNHFVNFGQEYVWHCHMLAHEEMDAMRVMVVASRPREPTYLMARYAAGAVILNWTDNSLDETGFTIERALDPAFTTDLTLFVVGPDITTYSDTIPLPQKYYYRVYADNLVGDSFDYTVQSPQAVNFPTLNLISGYSNVGSPLMPVQGTTRMLTLAQAVAPSAPVVMTWSYAPAGDQTGYIIQRATNPTFTTNVVTYTVGNVSTYSDSTSTMASGTRYYYRVTATNAIGSGTWSNYMTITVHTPPPLGITVMAKPTQALARNSPIIISWTYSPSGDETGFTVQRATNAAFTQGLRNINVAAGQLSYSDAINGLRVGTNYYYRVVPFNGAGNGAVSNALSIVVHR
jgi:FtsP/CotA-like multicopper oxidase with cupredoxin domain